MIIKDSGARPGISLAAQLLQTLAGEALAACDPAAAVRRAVHVRPGHLSLCGRPISMTKKGRLLVIAFGKAAPAMTKGLLQKFQEAGGKRLFDALVVHPPDGAPQDGPAPDPSDVRSTHRHHQHGSQAPLCSERGTAGPGGAPRRDPGDPRDLRRRSGAL